MIYGYSFRTKETNKHLILTNLRFIPISVSRVGHCDICKGLYVGRV